MFLTASYPLKHFEEQNFEVLETFMGNKSSPWMFGITDKVPDTVNFTLRREQFVLSL
jgi:hypothetical protein